MSILNNRLFQNTQRKLKELEEQCATINQKPAASPRTRELTVRSLNHLIKQLKEEIARYESRVTETIKTEWPSSEDRVFLRSLIAGHVRERAILIVCARDRTDCR